MRSMIFRTTICIWIGFLFCSPDSYGNTWIQSNWSGGAGHLWWADSSEYYIGNKIEGLDSTEISLIKHTWQYLSRLSGAGKVYTLVDSSANILYATADSGAVLFKSINCGSTWACRYGDGGWPHNFCCMIFSNSIYVGMRHSGGNGFITKTQNDGTSWTYSSVSEQGIYSISSAADSLIIAGTGRNAAIYRGSIESGWAKQDIPEDSIILCLKRAYNNKIYAGTGNLGGIIFVSNNNGSLWNQVVDLPSASSVYSIVQATDSVLYAGTGPSGVIYKSVNGSVWNTTTSIPGALEVRALACDSQGGIYAGVSCSDDSGYVFYSGDKGDSWIQVGSNAVSNGKILSLLYTAGGRFLAGTDSMARIFEAPKYDTIGSIISSIYNTGVTNGSVNYDTILWDADYNSQDVIIKVRTFQDTTTWSDTIPWDSCPACTNGQNLSSLSSVQNGKQFIQYRVDLISQNPCVAPIFKEIRINYSMDTLAPVITGAVASGLVPNDKVEILFDESVDTSVSINAGNIDSILKLSYNHKWNIDSAGWDTSYKKITITLSDSSEVMVGDTIYPYAYLTDSISDKWGNKCVSNCIITGTFAPMIDSIIASDGANLKEYIDNDDYVAFYFSKRTDTASINAGNIDDVLRIHNHTWLDGKGEIDTCKWDSLGFVLSCFLKTDSLRPTIAVGDTVFPDSATIQDFAGKGAVISPCVIMGTFGEYGPVMDSAKAFEGGQQESGIGDGDYILIYFNKQIQNIQWGSANLDSVLKLRKNGVQHTWYLPDLDSIDCYAQAIDTADLQGVRCNWLYISFTKKTGVEEDAEYHLLSAGLSAYPSPFISQVTISFTVSGMVSSGQKQNKPFSFNLAPSITIGDTIYPDSILIKDFKNKRCVKPVVLGGSFSKKDKGQCLPLTKSEDNPQLKLGRSNTNSAVALKIYNLNGQLVRTLAEGVKQPGAYTLVWDGKDDYSRRVKTGVYVCKLIVNKEVLTQKIVLLK